jgi:putative PIN family toxin of toxin-antitoxin system
MRRVVLDTNVLVAGLRSRRGASFAVLRLVSDRQVRPLVTTALLLEYEAVLNRTEQRAVHEFSPTDLERLLAGLASVAEPVERYFSWRPQLGDPEDEMVLEAAINGRADALVTYNRRHFESIAARFALQVLSPAELLKGFLS